MSWAQSKGCGSIVSPKGEMQETALILGEQFVSQINETNWWENKGGSFSLVCFPFPFLGGNAPKGNLGLLGFQILP